MSETTTRARVLYVEEDAQDGEGEEFFLEPDWDQMLIEFGEPDLMKDVDWEFHWPTDPPKPPVKRRTRRTPARK